MVFWKLDYKYEYDTEDCAEHQQADSSYYESMEEAMASVLNLCENGVQVIDFTITRCNTFICRKKYTLNSCNK